MPIAYSSSLGKNYRDGLGEVWMGIKILLLIAVLILLTTLGLCVVLLVFTDDLSFDSRVYLALLSWAIWTLILGNGGYKYFVRIVPDLHRGVLINRFLIASRPKTDSDALTIQYDPAFTEVANGPRLSWPWQGIKIYTTKKTVDIVCEVVTPAADGPITHAKFSFQTGPINGLYANMVRNDEIAGQKYLASNRTVWLSTYINSRKIDDLLATQSEIHRDFADSLDGDLIISFIEDQIGLSCRNLKIVQVNRSKEVVQAREARYVAEQHAQAIKALKNEAKELTDKEVLMAILALQEKADVRSVLVSGLEHASALTEVKL